MALQSQNYTHRNAQPQYCDQLICRESSCMAPAGSLSLYYRIFFSAIYATS